MTSHWIANPIAYQDRPDQPPGIDVSLEVFPPSDELSSRSFQEQLYRLAALSPGFVSVTCGAGGSGSVATLATLENVRALTDAPVAAHITGIDKSRDAFDDAVRAHLKSGIQHLVVLRGDPAPGEVPHPDSYPCARDMVAAVRSIAGSESLRISVAGYPEGHPDASTAAEEIDYLKAKVDAGADQIITQFFFDTEVYVDFCKRVRDAGIFVPVIPGILPIENFDRMVRFAGRCGACVPKWYHTLYRDLDHNQALHQEISVSIAVEQCRQLMAFGVRAFHFYTLNRAPLTLEICYRLTRARTNSGLRAGQLRGAA